MIDKDCDSKITNWYEYSYLRLCKYWLQKERCSDCLFDNLCTPEDKKQDKNKWNSKNKKSN